LSSGLKAKRLCPFDKKEQERFDFNITKVDKIFDLLLGQIKLSLFRTIPSAEELKRMKYHKRHNVMSHDTNDSISH
jgi:hypothetical protein